MANYNFNSNLLSGGDPSALNVSLSSTRLTVVIDTLSSARGVAFSAHSLVTGTSGLVAVTVQGNNLRISAGHHNESFALIRADRTASMFTFLSTGGSLTPSETTVDLTYPALRRLVTLGYV